jgi:hypothetical protein
MTLRLSCTENEKCELRKYVYSSVKIKKMKNKPPSNEEFKRKMN